MTEIIINLRFHEIFHSKKTIGDMHAQCFRFLLFIIYWFDISLQTQTDEDGKTSLEFSIEASEQKFTLHCPSHYPNYGNDDNFFVEADSGLQMWCNALNEYLLDTDGQLSLSAILDKGLSLYSAADARSRSREVSMSSTFNDDDDDYEEVLDIDEEDEGPNEDDQMEDILDNDLSWELEIGRRKKRWRLKEAQLRAERQKNADASGEERSMQQLYHDPSIKGRQPKQVLVFWIISAENGKQLLRLFLMIN